MRSDNLAWIAVLIFIAGIVAGVMGYTTAAWVLVVAGIALVVYAKVKG